MARLTLTSLGGAGTVTGSKHVLSHGARRLMVDCGLFQGLKALRLQNWQPLAVGPTQLDKVVLTHAHLDHSGYLPRLVRDGYGGDIVCTEATAAASPGGARWANSAWDVPFQLMTTPP